MTHRPRTTLCLLILCLLTMAAGPALAADAPAPPAVEADLAVQPAPAITPAEPAVEGALEQARYTQYGDCALWCSGQQHWHYGVSRGVCCSGTLTCPDGSYSSGYAFFPYQGHAEFCSV